MPDAGALEKPPPGLTGRELREWVADQEAKDRPQIVRLPEFAGAVILSTLHYVYPPGSPGTTTDEYARLWPWLWYSCHHPERPADEAMLLDTKCPRCDEQWILRGLPLPSLPPLPPGAPVMRSF